MNPKSTTAWAIQNDGYILKSTIREKSLCSWRNLLGDPYTSDDYDRAVSKGYTCIPVTITPREEKADD